MPSLKDRSSAHAKAEVAAENAELASGVADPGLGPRRNKRSNEALTDDEEYSEDGGAAKPRKASAKSKAPKKAATKKAALKKKAGKKTTAKAKAELESDESAKDLFADSDGEAPPFAPPMTGPAFEPPEQEDIFGNATAPVRERVIGEEEDGDSFQQRMSELAAQRDKNGSKVPGSSAVLIWRFDSFLHVK